MLAIVERTKDEPLLDQMFFFIEHRIREISLKIDRYFLAQSAKDPNLTLLTVAFFKIDEIRCNSGQFCKTADSSSFKCQKFYTSAKYKKIEWLSASISLTSAISLGWCLISI